MKLRITLLLVAAALLVAPYAGHADSLASTAPALCAANVATPALPGFSAPSSDVLLKAIIGPTCGVCSGSPCVGAKLASICGIGGGGQYKFCADVGDCPQDGHVQCTCKTGPPL